jgi:hypothetical protein
MSYMEYIAAFRTMNVNKLEKVRIIRDLLQNDFAKVKRLDIGVVLASGLFGLICSSSSHQMMDGA